MTKEQVLEMIDRATYVSIGVEGREGMVYFPTTKEIVKQRADVIAGYGLSIEFGESAGLTDGLYIEAAR